MSIKIMSMVFDRYPAGGGEMLLALALADHAHDDGTNIYPSVNHLSIKTRQSERTIQYQLRKMEECGWLVLVADEKGGRGKAREYRINREWLKGAEIAPIIKGATDDIKGATDDIKGAIAVAPESSITIIEPSITIKDGKNKNPHPSGCTLSKFLDECKEKNEPPIPKDDGVFDYAADVGIPYEFLELAWLDFKRIHTDPARKEGRKKQKCWRKTFKNYVSGNYLRIWFIDNSGQFILTTRGKQLQREVA